jgi:hypothetical protein
MCLFRGIDGVEAVPTKNSELIEPPEDRRTVIGIESGCLEAAIV